MEKHKTKCAEIFHLKSHLEIICTICSEKYDNIYHFCNHLIEEHFHLRNEEFLKNFLRQEGTNKIPNLSFKVETDQSKNDLILKNEQFEEMETDSRLEIKKVLENFDMDAYNMDIQKDTNLQKSDSEVDPLEEDNALNSDTNISEENIPLQFDKLQKQDILEKFVALDCGRFSCKICDSKVRKYHLKKHLSSHDHSRYKYQCNICQKLFVSDLTLSLHSRNFHKQHRPYKCEHENCNKTFVDEKSLKVHLKYHDSRPYKCPICPSDFVYQSKLKVHISRHYKNTIKNDLSFENKAETTCETKMSNVEPESQVLSDNIKADKSKNKRFKQIQQIKKKRKIIPNKDAEKVVCEVCGKAVTKHKLYYHLKVHDDSRYSFQCEICKKMFISTKSLINHIKVIHTKELPFKCDWKDCDKKFVDQSSLKAHKNRHASDRPFKCQACSKGFIYEYKRDHHYKTYHVNGRIFKCEVCQKGFYEQHDLNKHKIIHSNVKPYACDQCPAKFLRERCLLWHKKQHSGIKDYFCKICGKGYALYNGIYSHMKIHGIKYSKDYEKGLTDGKS